MKFKFGLILWWISRRGEWSLK